MGETPIEEMVEGRRRMFACFAEMGVDLPHLNVEEYCLREISAHASNSEGKPVVEHLALCCWPSGPRSRSSSLRLTSPCAGSNWSNR